MYSDYWLCKVTIPDDVICTYYTILTIFKLFLPFCLIGTFQHLAYRELQKSARQFGNNSQMICNIRKASHTFIVVSAVFLLLTAPICIYTVSCWFIENDTTYTTYTILNKVEIRIFSLIESINSCTNPLIYGKIHRPIIQMYRRLVQLIKRIVGRRRHCQDSQQAHITVKISMQVLKIKHHSKSTSSNSNKNNNNSNSNDDTSREGKELRFATDMHII